MRHFGLFIIVLILFIACKNENDSTSSSDPVKFECLIDNVEPKGERKVGIDLLNSTETGTFEDNIVIAKDMGIEFLTLHTNWSDIEPSPEIYADPFNAFILLSTTAKNNNLKLNLTIRPIDIPGKTVPSDLENTRFSDPLMINRFTSMLDFVFAIVDEDLVLNLQIGNEIDGFNTSAEHPDFWSDYGAFLFGIKQHVQQNYPNIKVGYTATLHGVIDNQVLFSALNNAVDIMGVTYYPIKSGFEVEEPDKVFEDFNSLVSLYPNKDIYIQEIGYQTASLNNSSENKQAEFYCNFFKVWDAHNTNIESVNFLRLNDLSLESAQLSAGPYGITEPVFIEYLRTLGIRGHDGKGQNKTAFDVIKSNLEARAW